MSCETWDAGTISLPREELPRVHAAVLAVECRAKQRLLEQAQEFWRGLTRKQRTDLQAYREAVRELHESTLVRAEELADTEPTNLFHNPPQWAQSDQLVEDAPQLSTLLHSSIRDGKPRRVLVADVAVPTARTATFHLACGATIAFDRKASTVYWHSGYGNSQAEHARRDRTAQALFGALAQVRWTPHTGGVFFGGDEYHRHEGREDYITEGFGPLGSQQAAHLTSHWRCAPGFYDKSTRRVPAGVSSGGQFTHRARSESDVRL